MTKVDFEASYVSCLCFDQSPHGFTGDISPSLKHPMPRANLLYQQQSSVLARFFIP